MDSSIPSFASCILSAATSAPSLANGNSSTSSINLPTRAENSVMVLAGKGGDAWGGGCLGGGGGAERMGGGA